MNWKLVSASITYSSSPDYQRDFFWGFLWSQTCTVQGIWTVHVQQFPYRRVAPDGFWAGDCQQIRGHVPHKEWNGSNGPFPRAVHGSIFLPGHIHVHFRNRLLFLTFQFFNKLLLNNKKYCIWLLRAILFFPSPWGLWSTSQAPAWNSSRRAL